MEWAEMTYNPGAADAALLDGQAVGRAGILAKGALAAGRDIRSREGGGSEGKDGGGELHFGWKGGYGIEIDQW